MDNLAYKDPPKYEILNGKITAMSPRPSMNHYLISENVHRILSNYFDGKPCKAFGDGVDLYLNEKDRFIPDGMVVCNREIITYDGVRGTPDLVLEILSPSTIKRDRIYKKNAYERAGVREYWLIDPMNKSVEVYILKSGKYEPDNIYTVYPERDLKEMTEEEKSGIASEFQCSIFDSLTISLEDVFYDMLPD